jgi:hypothetical protein
MPTKHDFTPIVLPIFIAEPQQHAVRKGVARAAISSRWVQAGILVATATAIGISTLSLGNPVTLFTNVTASLVDNSAIQRRPDQGASTIDTGVPALPPAAEDVPERSITVHTASAGQSQTENSGPSSEVLVKQFQAWAADQDALAPAGQVRSVQDAPARVVTAQAEENAPAPVPRMQKHRHVRPVHSAHAEIRPVQIPRQTARRQQSARVQVPPEQHARALRQPVQNGPPLSLLQTFGQRN